MSKPCAATFGVKDLCERYGVGEHTILSWIRNGELLAIDVSRQQGGRPHWRITQQAITDFEALRAATPQQPRTRTHRRKPDNVIPFYK